MKIPDLMDGVSMPQRKWLVTGVAGFIGSNLLQKLLILNQIVVGLDNFSTGFSSNLESVRRAVGNSLWSNFTFSRGDIRSFDDCVGAVEGCNYVLHQAALGSVPRSIANPRDTHEVNVTGFLNMLMASNMAGVQRFVYASSSSVYGDNVDAEKVESKTGSLLSPYAVTKYTNELYANNFNRVYGIEAIGLRYFNVFGPRQSSKGEYAAVIPTWINAILKDENVFINGDGSISRDFTYITNIVNANILAATSSLHVLGGQVFNIGAGGSVTLNQLYDLIVKQLPSSRRPIYREGRGGDVLRSQASINKAAREIGYKVSGEFEDGLIETIRWYEDSSIKNNCN